MNILRRLASQPFVVATGFAALIHSTWSLGTFFSGPQPGGGWALIGWLIPALLIAFSLDVGQIVTSAEIRAGLRGWEKYATFIVFAVATYYLQFVYIASFMPAVTLGAGVSLSLVPFISAARDLGVFILPALLPLSTLLYTFSQNDDTQAQPSLPSAKIDARIDNALTSTDTELMRLPDGTWLGICSNGDYTVHKGSEEGAKRSLSGHQKKHKMPPERAAISANGHGEHVSAGERGE